MKKDLMEILCCPVCKGELQLTIKREEGGEIIEGSLFCAKCNETYPLENGTPDLRPPGLR